MLWLPSKRVTNPISNSNWEGVGVKPHIKTNPEHALDRAHMMALEKLAANNKEDEFSIYQWYLTAMKGKLNKVRINEETLKKYVGSYGPRTLLLEDGVLYYQRKGRSKLELTALNDTEFMVQGKDHFRLKVILDGDEVVALQGLTDNGSIRQNARDKR